MVDDILRYSRAQYAHPIGHKLAPSPRETIAQIALAQQFVDEFLRFLNIRASVGDAALRQISLDLEFLFRQKLHVGFESLVTG